MGTPERELRAVGEDGAEIVVADEAPLARLIEYATLVLIGVFLVAATTAGFFVAPAIGFAALAAASIVVVLLLSAGERSEQKKSR